MVRIKSLLYSQNNKAERTMLIVESIVNNGVYSLRIMSN